MVTACPALWEADLKDAIEKCKQNLSNRGESIFKHRMVFFSFLLDQLKHWEVAFGPLEWWSISPSCSLTAHCRSCPSAMWLVINWSQFDYYHTWHWRHYNLADDLTSRWWSHLWDCLAFCRRQASGPLLRVCIFYHQPHLWYQDTEIEMAIYFWLSEDFFFCLSHFDALQKFKVI